MHDLAMTFYCPLQLIVQLFQVALKFVGDQLPELVNFVDHYKLHPHEACIHIRNKKNQKNSRVKIWFFKTFAILSNLGGK